MTRSTSAQSSTALANLRTILGIHAQMSRENQEARLSSTANAEVHRVLGDILDSAEEHRDVLESLIRDWEAHERKTTRLIRPTVEARLEPRELIESWIAIKDAASEMYRKAATSAPTARIRRELEHLAREEDELAGRLRELL